MDLGGFRKTCNYSLVKAISFPSSPAHQPNANPLFDDAECPTCSMCLLHTCSSMCGVYGSVQCGGQP